MKRKVYVFASTKGFLQDIEKYTDNVEEAAFFVDEQSAIKKLISINKLLSSPCLIETVYIDFPKKHKQS